MRQAWSRMKDPWKSRLARRVANDGLLATAKALESSPMTVTNLLQDGVVRESVLQRIQGAMDGIRPRTGEAQRETSQQLSCP